MISLRRRLTLSLWLALIVVGLLSAIGSYVVAERQTSALLDYQMQEIAGLVGAQSFVESKPGPIFPQIDLNHDDDDDFLITVRDVNGDLLYASDPKHVLPAMGWLGFRTLDVNGGSYRIFSGHNGPTYVLVAQQLEARDDTAASAALIALLPIGLILPVLGLIIGLVIRQQLRPLREMAAGVSRREALAFEPLPLEHLPAEVRPLVVEINRLLSRLESAVKHEQRFVSDAAHSLRTPLTALRLQADILNGSSDPQENATRLRELRAGITRAIRLSDHLLALARNETSAGPVRGSIALDEALAETIELYSVTAEASEVLLTLNADSHAKVPGDARYLALLAGNLIENALRYSPPGGEVIVSSRREGERVVFEVADQGPGLPEAELEKVFERFHRAPDDATEGSGLGLAVVRGIVLRLGGSVRLANRVGRGGLIAQVELPFVSTVTASEAVLRNLALP